MANPDETKPEIENGSKLTSETDKTVPVPEKIELTKDLEYKIIRQIEYYFGDINLPKDKFLQEQIQLDDGWVSMVTLMTFQRLKSLCPDAEVIVTAILNSENDLIEVSEDRKKIRRNPGRPVPELNDERRKELMSRTAYVKGFVKDDQLEDIQKFLEPYGPVESIHMRSYKDKILKKFVFKGSIFAIFKDVETCKKFLETERLTYNDKPLILKWQEAYNEEKRQEREERDNRKNKNKVVVTEEQHKPHNFPKGSMLHLDGIGDETARESIKRAIIDAGGEEPAYITFDKGDTSGFVRFAEEGAAIEFAKKLTDNKLLIDDIETTARVLEGEEEETFLKNLSETLHKQRTQNKHHGKGKNRKRRGGGHDGGSRSKRERK